MTRMAGDAGYPLTGTVECDECGQSHVAEFHHLSTHGGDPVYAVICTTNNPDMLTDWYLVERLITREG